MSMTPKQLRDVALALDALDAVSGHLLEAALLGAKTGSSKIILEIELTGAMWQDEERLDKMLGWVGGDDMQQSLRAFADELEAQEEQE